MKYVHEYVVGRAYIFKEMEVNERYCEWKVLWMKGIVNVVFMWRWTNKVALVVF